MDIMHLTWTTLWNLSMKIDPGFTSLALRLDLIFALCIALGFMLIVLFRKGILKDTSQCQTLIPVISAMAGLWIPLGFIFRMDADSRTMLLFSAACMLGILPAVSVKFIIRQAGNQIKARKICYLAIIILLVAQTAYSILR